ncbi:MAG: hypothetical protein DLM60_17500 [Pseudonocardiales bacterium]|nr:MAG: hypothetical protein DLM60_17500 [Pseudonocardiales bacterium]
MTVAGEVPGAAISQRLSAERNGAVHGAVVHRDEHGDQRNEPDDPYRESGPSVRLGQILCRSALATLPVIEDLVAGVLSVPSAALMIGTSGIGKSFTGISIGCCVATGKNWLNHRVPRRRRTLMIVGEGASGLDPRIHAWEMAWNNGVPVPDEWLTVLVKPNSLNNADTWTALREYAVNGGYGFVIFDTLSSLAPDADETKDAARIMRRLSDLSTAINGAALLIHHPGWSDPGRARGGSQLEANADEILVLKEAAEGSDMFTMTRKKVKDGPSGGVHWLRRTHSHGSIIIEGCRSDDVTIPLRERILAVLTNYGDVGATGPELIAEIGVDDNAKSGFYRALGKLRDAGLVTEKTIRNTKRYFIVPGQESGA